jgi:hypothetical protein
VRQGQCLLTSNSFVFVHSSPAGTVLIFLLASVRVHSRNIQDWISKYCYFNSYLLLILQLTPMYIYNVRLIHCVSYFSSYRSGTYVPTVTRDNDLLVSSTSEPQLNILPTSSFLGRPYYNHNYKNYKPYDPSKIKAQYQKNYAYLDTNWNIKLD